MRLPPTRSRLLPTVPGGLEMPQREGPTIPEAPDVLEDVEEARSHVLRNKWSEVQDETQQLFDRKKQQGYYSLAPELRNEPLRSHRHLGHMPPDQLARVLADAGAKAEVIQWCKRHFECPMCKATIKPGLRHPAAARKVYQFNRTVGSDHLPTISRRSPTIS